MQIIHKKMLQLLFSEEQQVLAKNFTISFRFFPPSYWFYVQENAVTNERENNNPGKASSVTDELNNVQ